MKATDEYEQAIRNALVPVVLEVEMAAKQERNIRWDWMVQTCIRTLKSQLEKCTGVY
jgi:hypothetical protein